MTRLEDLRVAYRCDDCIVSDEHHTRDASVSDLVAALEAEGGKVGYFIDMDADVPDEFSPGRYLVFRLEVDGV